MCVSRPSPSAKAWKMPNDPAPRRTTNQAAVGLGEHERELVHEQ